MVWTDKPDKGRQNSDTESTFAFIIVIAIRLLSR